MLKIHIDDSLDDVGMATAELFMLSTISLSLMIRLRIESGELDAEVAAEMLRGISEEALPDRVRAVLNSIADGVVAGDGPLLTVINGGKTPPKRRR